MTTLEITIKGIKKVDKRFKGVKKAIEDSWVSFERKVRTSVRMKSPIGGNKENRKGKTPTQILRRKDTGGNFRRSWNIPPSSPVKRSMDIRNSAEYAGAVIFGSEKGKKPWPNAGALTTDIGTVIYSNETMENGPNKGTFEQSVFDEDRLTDWYSKFLDEELTKIA